jgi:hypothetical protein
MKRPTQLIKSVTVLALCLLLQACGAIKLTYNNADTLLYFWLDGYVDVTLDQKVRVKNELLALQQWHRKTQLPTFISMTQTLQKQVVGDVTPALLCSNPDQALALVPPLTQYLEPSVLWLVTNLSSDQIQSIADKFVKTNKEWRKEWQPESKEDLTKFTLKSLRERIDPLYGKPTDAQLALLQGAIAASPFDARVAYAERLRRQKDMLETLNNIQSKKLGADAAKEPMKKLLERNADSPDLAYRAYSERIKQHNCTLFAKLHNSMSGQQRAYALEKLKDYERDFRSLQLQP